MQEGKKFTLSPQPTQQQEFLRGGKHRQFAIYEVGEFTSIGKALNIAAQHESPVQYGMVSAPPVYAHRYITGQFMFHFYFITKISDKGVVKLDTTYSEKDYVWGRGIKTLSMDRKELT